MIDWRPAACDKEVAPEAAAALLSRAVEAKPNVSQLRLMLADLQLEQSDFAAAGANLETVLKLEPAAAVRQRLAVCYNQFERYADTLELTAAHGSPLHERAVALMACGRAAEAEREWRALLSAEPNHISALRFLGKALRRTGRLADLLETCETLSARGVGHAQLFYTWGVALALTGHEEQARALLFDPSKILVTKLPLPAGFTSLEAFNDAVEEELLSNPYRFESEANRGSTRVHALLSGRQPQLIRALLAAIQETVDLYAEARSRAPDLWSDARPAVARLQPWALIQRGQTAPSTHCGRTPAEWHLHRAGWISGVYYVRIPGSVSEDGDGRGCIEFGAPRSLEAAMPGYIPVWRHRPEEGTLLLAPSHFPHRTIRSGMENPRISLALDVVPMQTARPAAALSHATA